MIPPDCSKQIEGKFGPSSPNAAILARQGSPLFFPLMPALVGSPGGSRGSPALSEGFLELEAQTISTE